VGLVLLDSSVLIGLINPDDKHHVHIMENFEASSLYAISALTLTEVLPNAVARGVAEEAQATLVANLHQVFDVSQEIAVAAAHIRASKGLRTPDAIISATASTIKATLWTCDAALAKAHRGAHLVL
jgi:predicted nucleic acid-binding protein